MLRIAPGIALTVSLSMAIELCTYRAARCRLPSQRRRIHASPLDSFAIAKETGTRDACSSEIGPSYRKHLIRVELFVTNWPKFFWDRHCARKC